MSATITSKTEIRKRTDTVIHLYNDGLTEDSVSAIHKLILQEKVRFPLLEFAASELYLNIPDKQQLAFTDRLIALNEIGSYVIAGMILQLRLAEHFSASLEKACDYIAKGNAWYVCDIVGERVMGHALLLYPEQSVPILRQLSQHTDKWLVRAVGVATHYAVKKGLKKKYAAQMFELLLSLSQVTEFHTKKGIGWAAKTIAKFHPDIIYARQQIIDHNTNIRPWFRTKIRIGLGRSEKYASRYQD